MNSTINIWTRVAVVTSVVLSCDLAISAQGSPDILSGDALEARFNEMVKSTGEFMLRFNETETHPLVQTFGKEDETLNLKMLFDAEGEPKRDLDAFMDKFDGFYESVKRNNVKLDFSSDKWYAEQEIEFVFKKKKVIMSLMLKPEKTPIGVDAWMVRGIRGMDKIMRRDSVKRLAISPEQNDSRFVELDGDLTMYADRFSKFRSYSESLDTLSYFFALVENGVLKYNAMADTKFHFFDVPDYAFDVEWFKRPTSNSGWLISELYLMPECEKPKYIKQLLGK